MFRQALDHDDTSSIGVLRKYDVSPSEVVVTLKIRGAVWNGNAVRLWFLVRILNHALGTMSQPTSTQTGELPEKAKQEGESSINVRRHPPPRSACLPTGRQRVGGRVHALVRLRFFHYTDTTSCFKLIGLIDCNILFSFCLAR